MSAEDYFEEAMTTIFDVVQPAEGTRNETVVFEHQKTGRLELVVPDVSAKNNKLMPQHLWRASRHLAMLLSDGGAGIDVNGLHCIELGAGTALPSVVCRRLKARTMIATDYDDVDLLASMKRNLAEHDVDVMALTWGMAEHISTVKARLHTVDAQAAGFDLLLCADVLWNRDAHESLLGTLLHLMSPTGRALVVSGLHGGKAPIARFIERACACGLVPVDEGLWETFHTSADEKLPWRPDAEPEIEDRGKWLVFCTLRRNTSNLT